LKLFDVAPVSVRVARDQGVALSDIVDVQIAEVATPPTAATVVCR